VCKLLPQRAYRHHQAEVRMRDLIAEEEAAGRLQDQRTAARAAADKEKRAKKKERKKAKKVRQQQGLLQQFVQGVMQQFVHCLYCSCSAVGWLQSYNGCAERPDHEQ
jgi:hypothetical protein